MASSTVYDIARPEMRVEEMLLREDGPTLQKLCDAVMQAGGMRALGKLSIDRETDRRGNLSCRHVLEADWISTFTPDELEDDPDDPTEGRLILAVDQTFEDVEEFYSKEGRGRGG